MTDKRKQNKGQPKKPEAEIKVPLTIGVKRRNKQAIRDHILPIIKKMDV